MQSSNSIFDPSYLFDTEYTDDLNTHLTPVPEGEFYACISKIDVRKNTGKDGKPDTFVADFVFIIDDEDVRTSTNLKEPQCRMSVFLDIGPGGQLLTKSENPNANVRLGRIKEALGFKPGKPWSFRRMEGMYCYVKVKQRTDPKDLNIVYSDVVSVAAESSRK